MYTAYSSNVASHSTLQKDQKEIWVILFYLSSTQRRPAYASFTANTPTVYADKPSPLQQKLFSIVSMLLYLANICCGGYDIKTKQSTV